MIKEIEWRGNVVKLNQLTVLVGPNDCGKTDLLQTIRNSYKPIICAEQVLTIGLLGIEGTIDYARKYEDGCALLIDRMSNDRHISAQVRDMLMLQDFLKSNSKHQAIVVTYSPFQLETVRPEDVRVIARGLVKNRDTTRVKPLLDHPEIEKYRVGFRTDELWANLGEGWVLNEVD